MIENTTRWAARIDAFRPHSDFSDLLKTVACHYDMYSRAANFIGPLISRQNGKTMFLVPTKQEISEALGKERAAVDFRARSAFEDGLVRFLSTFKGKKTLITPNPSTHHSAQFPKGTFEIKQVSNQIEVRSGKSIRKPARTLHQINLAGIATPLYVENLNVDPDSIRFLIVRPKLGQLGTAAVDKWEVLCFKESMGYMVEHVDSFINPRYSGIIN